MIIKNSGLDETTIQTEIQKYCYFDEAISYTRNLIATDHENYTLLLLCWNKSESPIHNHPGDGCYMRVVAGSIVEKLYDVQQRNSAASTKNTHDVVDSDAATTTLECTATNHYETNMVAFINDAIGYHSIGCGLANPYSTSASVPGAMSLHLYCPPIKQCQVVVKSSLSSDGDDVNHTSDTNTGTSNVYIRDSGPMHHHTEYGHRL
jgi:cysteine dioxygenase